ncbi:MAG: protein-methionine-sulfoxide reductase catalytic subunit MsrP [Pseudomonadales bacterium]|nr:protein-methionine-sulfoxide reductase catalytic subunit MsrP [Pseudomonadales bacterium]
MKDLAGKALIDEITPLRIFQKRRQFLIQAIKLGLISSAACHAHTLLSCEQRSSSTGISSDALTDSMTEEKKVTHYNNYYEFSTNKEVVHILARELKTSPWPLSIGGEVDKPLQLDFKDLIKTLPLETRIYRFRCVEGWSMVVPWQGFPLCALLEKVKPKSTARFVKFQSIYRPDEMINQRSYNFPWPYTEGLRLDEAMHPLAFIATGMYGKPLPKQNGSPLRIILPWKYGFKSIKAVQTIQLEQQATETGWMQSAPGEYGFYANVNPEVSHPRWSQRREVRLGQIRKQRTLMFNGYADQVEQLYAGMDLKIHF